MVWLFAPLLWVSVLAAVPPLECVVNLLANLTFKGRVNSNPASDEFQVQERKRKKKAKHTRLSECHRH